MTGKAIYSLLFAIPLWISTVVAHQTTGANFLASSLTL